MNIEQFLTDNPDWRDDCDLIVAPPSQEEVTEWFPDAEFAQVVISPDTWISQHVSRRALYVRLRREGNPHRWSEMLALQRAPRIMTDSVFFAGMPRLAEQFGSQKHLARHLAVAKRHGYTPNSTDVYQPGLARFQGDPEAFVPATGGRGYITKLCKQRGWACEGAVNIEARQPEHDPFDKCVPLAPDLVRAGARKLIAKNPDMKRLSRGELRQAVVDKYGPSK